MAKPVEPSRRAYISLNKDLFAKLQKRSQETGCPIGVLVELAVSGPIGAPLTKSAQRWHERLAAK